MALSASVSLTVQDLPDNDYWFINAQAWHNYWKNLTGEVTLDPATTTLYTPVGFNSNLFTAVRMNVDGTPYTLAPLDMLLALSAQVTALDQSYQLLRTQLKNAGFITTAQTS